MGDVKVAIAGLGNCASALIQGTHYYRNAKVNEEVPGLMHVDFGGYFPKDIKFVAAFEANRKKIGLDIADAMWVEPNCCVKFAPDVPKTGVKVLPGPISDGVAPHMRESFFAYDENEYSVLMEDLGNDSVYQLIVKKDVSINISISEFAVVTDSIIPPVTVPPTLIAFISCPSVSSLTSTTNELPATTSRLSG